MRRERGGKESMLVLVDMPQVAVAEHVCLCVVCVLSESCIRLLCVMCVYCLCFGCVSSVSPLCASPLAKIANVVISEHLVCS